MPQADPEGNQTHDLAGHLAKWAEARVLLFPDTWPGDLDSFFRLRLLQVLQQQPPLPTLSIVVLSPEMTGQKLAAGFADRFRAGWPFARCVFLTEGDGHAALSTQLGLPVTSLDDLGLAPEVLQPDADSRQKVAVVVQRAGKRCGDTTLFENQVEDLVRAGFLTIRVFTNGSWRRGATLRSRINATIRENSLLAGAHVDIVAVPDGPPSRLAANDPDVAWRSLLTASAACGITDDAIVRGVAQAECAIVNDLECIGPAIVLSPQARMILTLQKDRAIALHHWAILAGKGEATAMKSAAAAARIQNQILGIPDLCTFASDGEMTRLASHCRRAITVLPRAAAPSKADRSEALGSAIPQIDLLLIGSEHGLNIGSLRWFLDRVWRPYLQFHSITVAIVGRVCDHLNPQGYDSPLLHFLGYVEDLEAIRSWCRLTVVPDTGGAGISMKLLSTLAAGHPLATTRIGLRGLDPSITRALPAYNTADALAADIQAVIASPAVLAERQRLVRQAQQALRGFTDYARLLMTIPRPSPQRAQERLAQWSHVVGVTPAPDEAPFAFTSDTAFPMSGTAWDRQVLLGGWHEPEPWGRWTDGADALLRITLNKPADDPLTLELDIVPSAVAANLRIIWDGSPLPLIDPAPGTNGWDIPVALTTGKTSFQVSLHVGETVCPALTSESSDDRILGIGVSAVRLLSHPPTLFRLNVLMPIRAGAIPNRVLLTGWQEPEDWGCWTSKATASLRLRLSEPMQGAMRLELNLALPPVRSTLTLAVNGTMLAPITPAEGFNTWNLPPRATNGRAELLVMLTVPETFNAARAGLSGDGRDLGVGLRDIQLAPLVTTFYEPGTLLELGAPEAKEVLVTGWHPAEDWGCWTSQAKAVLRLTLRRPVFGPFRLELDLMELPVATELTLSANGVALPAIVPVGGINRWILPEHLIDDQQTLVIGLETAATFSPNGTGGSTDTRIVGIGLRRLALLRETAAACPIATLIEVSSQAGDRGILLTGWHRPEPWGCWSSGLDASMLLRFDKPLRGAYVLETELTPPLLDPAVTLSVEGTVLDTIPVVEGPNEWILPADGTEGKTELLVKFMVQRPARPMDVMDSKDDRSLGVGLRNFRLRPIHED